MISDAPVMPDTLPRSQGDTGPWDHSLAGASKAPRTPPSAGASNGPRTPPVCVSAGLSRFATLGVVGFAQHFDESRDGGRHLPSATVDDPDGSGETRQGQRYRGQRAHA